MILKKNIKRYYQEQSQAVQVVHKQDTTAISLTKVPTTLLLKWLTDKPVWVKQWPMMEEKLHTLGQLIPEKLNAQHIKKSTSPWNSPVFVIIKKSGKWRMLKRFKNHK